jgi:septation ring formation regulator EzrA
MKNKLIDLNNHLFAQIERLSEEGMTVDQIEAEAKRADAIVAVSDQILAGARLQITAVNIIAQHGDRFKSHLGMIEDKSS